MTRRWKSVGFRRKRFGRKSPIWVECIEKSGGPAAPGRARSCLTAGRKDKPGRMNSAGAGLSTVLLEVRNILHDRCRCHRPQRVEHEGMPPPAELPVVAPFAAFRTGVLAAWTSVLAVVTSGTFLGIGALAHDLGYSLAWAVAGAVLIWAAPAQVIVMSALATGAALLEIAIAVTLTAVRLLPMSVSLLPVLRGANTPNRHLIMPAHFISITVWVEGLRLLPAVARENRVAYLNGIGTGFTANAVVFTVAGFFLAGSLPLPLAAALLFLTPLSFLLSTAGNARTLADRAALALGLVVGPALALWQVQFDLLWAGIIGGTVGYAVQRLRRAPN